MDRWNKMSLTEQYESVFGHQDPSTKKLKDLCYSIKVVSRKIQSEDGFKCAYCSREVCEGCPLPFHDKKTLY